MTRLYVPLLVLALELALGLPLLSNILSAKQWQGLAESQCSGYKAFIILSWYGNFYVNQSLPNCQDPNSWNISCSGFVANIRDQVIISNVGNNLSNQSACLEFEAGHAQEYLILHT